MHDDDRLWAIVVFVRQLPEMTPKDYAVRTSAAEGDARICIVTIMTTRTDKRICRALGHSDHGFDRQSRSLPFGITVLKPANGITSRAKRCDCLERENAVGTAAIGDDLAVRWQLGQAMLQFPKRDIEGAGKMSKGKFVFGPHVENHDKPVTQPGDHVLSRHRLQRVAGMEVVGHDATDLGHVPLAHASERPHQLNHFRIAGEPIQHALSASFGIDEARTPKDLQVSRGVGEAQFGPRRKFLNAAHALGDVLQQFQPVGVTESLGHLGEAGQDHLFGFGT